jgi:hypothetical protein
MNITNHNLTFNLTVKEVGVWMAALRMAAKHHTMCIPWDSNPFLEQHKELVRLTGYGTGDHEDLYNALAKKAKEQGISSMQELKNAGKKLEELYPEHA